MYVKAGNLRNLGRVSLLVPLYQKDSSLLYFNGIGMFDSTDNREGNFGIGLRHKIDKNNILGSFIHYDRRKSPGGHLFNQMSLGLEWFQDSLEVHLNGYLPISQKNVVLEKQAGLSPKMINRQYYISTIKTQVYETPLSGIDAEVGCHIPKTSIEIYGGYYHFFTKKTESVYGPRFRTQININNILIIQGEIQYDKPRKLSYFAGIGIKIGIGKIKSTSLSILDRKMIQMPQRDIDIVVLKAQADFDVNVRNATPIESWQSLNIFTRANLSGNFLILNDLDASDTAATFHEPIGTLEAYFTGIILGASLADDGTIIEAQRTINNLHINRVSTNRFIGLFGVAQHAHISYLTIRHARLTAMDPDKVIGP